MDLEQFSSVHGADWKVYQQAKARWDSLAKPLGSLGRLEIAISRIAALTGCVDVQIKKRTLAVFCADNGVVAQGVSQSDASVTEAVARALGKGCSTVNYMLRGLDCAVLPVNVGMVSSASLDGVLFRRVRFGTEDMTLGPSMTRSDCCRAMEVGFRLAQDLHSQGSNLLLAGEMGIGNTTTSAAVLSVLLDRSPEELTGRGAGLSPEGLVRKRLAIRRALAINRPDPADPIDVLTKVGGLDLAALCGFCLGGAACRCPVLLDGLITCTAALCAIRLCPLARDALLASHRTAEPAGDLVLSALGVEPLLTAGLRLGEGSGAAAALPLLDMALRVYHSGNTFDSIGIDAYQPL